MLKPKDIDWISYSKLKQEFIPELQHFKHPDMYRTQVGYSYSIDQSGEIKDISKISSVKAFQNGSKTNNQKHERVNFLEQLDMKRKYFKSGYAIASPVKEFKSHNTDREVPVKSVMKSIDVSV